ncbi:MAG: tetratricopeptide repeat protein [Flavobacteriales bacterium]|nr:tetratricopeptide repeat protein [Flavobacteriales bacterium]
MSLRPLLPFLLMLLMACGGSSTGPGHPAASLDSLTFRPELDTAREMLRRGDIEGVERIAQQVLRDSKGAPALRKQRMQARSLQGQVYQWRAELDSALLMHEEVLRMAEASLDTFWIGAAWINIGVARDLQGDYAGAMQAGYSAMRWKELLGDRLSMARVLHNLSALQWRRDSTEQALALLQRSLAIKRELDTPALASGLNGLGVLLIDLGRMDTAIAVLRESLLLEDSLNSGATRENMGSNLGLAFERAGMLDSAAHHYRQGLYDARQHGNQEVAIRCLYGLGDVRRAQGRYAEARTFLDSSLVLAQRIGSLEDEKEAHLSLVQL